MLWLSGDLDVAAPVEVEVCRFVETTLLTGVFGASMRFWIAAFVLQNISTWIPFKINAFLNRCNAAVAARGVFVFLLISLLDLVRLAWISLGTGRQCVCDYKLIFWSFFVAPDRDRDRVSSEWVFFFDACDLLFALIWLVRNLKLVKILIKVEVRRLILIGRDWRLWWHNAVVSWVFGQLLGKIRQWDIIRIRCGFSVTFYNCHSAINTFTWDLCGDPLHDCLHVLALLE